MKKTIQELKLGQKIEAVLVEILNDHDMIASFRGDLLRVTNHTGRLFCAGESIELEAVSISPLRFRLFADTDESKRTGAFDRTI
jgi:hypothetical protein